MMVPVAALHSVDAAGTSPPDTLNMEYPKRTGPEERDEEQVSKSKVMRLQNRKQRTESQRNRRSSDGASVIRVLGSIGHDELENEDDEVEADELMAEPEPVQIPPPSQGINTSLPTPRTSLLSTTHPVSQPMIRPQPTPPPTAPTPLILAKPGMAKIAFKAPVMPPQPADVVHPIQLPPINSPSQSSRTTEVASSALPASTSQSISSSTTTKWSLPALTAVITMPIPGLAANVMKEVEVLPAADPTATPTANPDAEPMAAPNSLGVTVTPASPFNALPSTGYHGSPGDHNHEQNDVTPALPTTGYNASPGDYNHDRNNGTPVNQTEKALIAVGSICGVLVLAFLAWFVWRMCKRRRSIPTTRDDPPPFSTDTPSAKRRHLFTKTLSRIPILKEHINGTDSGWTNLDHSFVGSRNEATGPAASSTGGAQQQLGQAPAIVVHTEIVRKSFHASQRLPKAHLRETAPRSVSSTEAQQNNTVGSGAQPRKSCPSDNSSLSSSFEDGQFKMNDNTRNNTNDRSINSNGNSDNLNGAYRTNNPAAVVTTINAPSFPPTRRDSAITNSERRSRRDTVCTETSEDLPPRFRTIQSWVRQQSNRVVRANQQGQSPSAQEASTPTVPKAPPG